MSNTNIFLRPLKIKDINQRYISWFSDPDVNRFLDARNISQKDSIEYLKKGIQSREYYIYAICDLNSNLHIGNLKIGPFKRRHGISDLVTVIGDKNYWGKKIATNAIIMAKNKAFTEGGLRKFTASIDSHNKASLSAYTNAGFEVEAIVPKYFVHKEHGSIIFSDKIYVGCENKNYNLKTFKNWHPMDLIS